MTYIHQQEQAFGCLNNTHDFMADDFSGDLTYLNDCDFATSTDPEVCAFRACIEALQAKRLPASAKMLGLRISSLKRPSEVIFDEFPAYDHYLAYQQSDDVQVNDLWESLRLTQVRVCPSAISISISDDRPPLRYPIRKIAKVDVLGLESQPCADQDSEGSSEDPDSEASTGILGHPRISPGLSNGQAGETRLRIKFSCFGSKGYPIQRFGKSGFVIPDDLSGVHEMYDQMWKFEIKHEVQLSSPLVLITWIITNIASGAVTLQKENPQQATLREIAGRTICNKVVKMALTSRADELEESWKTMKEGCRKQAVENSIRVLRPKLCTVGLLFFGLLHDTVQRRFV